MTLFLVDTNELEQTNVRRSVIVFSYFPQILLQNNLNRIIDTFIDNTNAPIHINAFCHHLRTLTSFSITVSTTLAFCSSRYRSL